MGAIPVKIFSLCAVLASSLLALGPALLCAQNLSNSDAPANGKCVLAGEVKNAITGERLRKAIVRLHLVSHTVATSADLAAQNRAARSDENGRFRFEGLEPGQYRLTGEHSGFLSMDRGAKDPTQVGTEVTLTRGEQVMDVHVALVPEAVISGRVVDDDGDPVSEVMVDVVTREWRRGKLVRARSGRFAWTDDRGEYRVTGLSAGKYYISAERREALFPDGNEASSAPGQPSRIRTFYPHAPNLERAIPVEVQAGQVLSGMEISLLTAPTYHIRGKIVGNLPTDAHNVMLNVMPSDLDMMMFRGHGNVNEDLTFDLAGIAPGSYFLNLLVMQSVGRAVTQVPIEVGTQDLNDVEIHVLPEGTLRGRVRIDGRDPLNARSTDLTKVRVGLIATEGSGLGNTPHTSANADGTFSLQEIIPRKYFANISGVPAGTYLKSVRLNGQEVLGRDLDLSHGGAGELEITFRNGAAELAGTIAIDQQSGPPASNASSDSKLPDLPKALLLLVPDTLNADGSGVRVTNSDKRGQFSFQQLPPGRYRVYAFEQGNPDQLQNADLLKQLMSKAADLDLKENDKKQIQISWISADELRQGLARAGIDLP